MSLKWEEVVVDCAEPAALGQWWATALGWVVVDDSPDAFEIVPAPGRLPSLMFVRVAERKTIKNRLHLDVRPDEDQAVEVARLVSLGAVPADIGQGGQSWVVMLDPEGNEFCVLAPPRRSTG